MTTSSADTGIQVQPGDEPFQVALEGVVFTMVDVHAGHDADFERWYEGDHFYAGGVLAPGVLNGQRFYSTPALRRSRYVSDDCPLPDPLLGTNLAFYFLTTGGLQSFYDFINPQLFTLRSLGRMFSERTHVNTDGYRVEQVLAFRGASTVRPHVTLDHPFAGVFVAYLDPRGDAPADPAVELPAGTLAVSLRPNEGSLTPESIGVTASQPGMTFPLDGAPVRTVLTFLTSAPRPDAQWAAGLTSDVARLTGSRPLWGGGFLPVVPGSLGHLSEIR
jgi:hypothetical protein